MLFRSGGKECGRGLEQNGARQCQGDGYLAVEVWGRGRKERQRGKTGDPPWGKMACLCAVTCADLNHSPGSGYGWKPFCPGP